MRCGYLDLFLLHRPDPLMDPKAVSKAFDFLQREGLVRHFGVSNFTPSQYRMLSSYLPPSVPSLVTNQIKMSPAHVSALFDGSLDMMMEARVRPMVYSPLRVLFGKDAHEDLVSYLRTICSEIRDRISSSSLPLPSSSSLSTTSTTTSSIDIDTVALAWLMRHPSGPLPVIGTSKPHRVATAADATLLVPHIDRQTWFKILQAERGHEVA
eukprot:TRINITY_DN3767_c0_g1_i3.p1 TRINITY_DN3767_c0_g1~~TRINITY_DN3767_c0_g1_i3.p1  ORF type:complete len:210 (+),score=27.47 TRINITY_DN3767_c0_g1_i3:426-1055(+)